MEQAKRAYLDYNASAPLSDAAREAFACVLGLAGNPSSVHREGRALRAVIDEARRHVAALAGAAPGQVVFTSGATEAAAFALSPQMRMGRGSLAASRLFVGVTEHACVLAGGRFGADARQALPVGENGLLDLSALETALGAHDRATGLAMVAVQAANNETGVIQPVAEIGRIAKAHGALFVCDAVQAAGRIPIDIAAWKADFVILSGHKVGGPAGIGALVAGSELLMPFPLVTGGGQEAGHRGGTENVAAIAGFGAAAAQAASLSDVERLGALRDRFEAAILQGVPDAIIVGAGAPRLANTSAVLIPGLKAETAVIGLDLAGFAVSAGSACSSGKVGRSHVLAAMGLDAEAGAIRVSLGASNTAGQVDALANELTRIASRRRIAAAAA